jgi:1-acyl-sn-glycerol-3-phosphate acyltransferase
LELASVLDFRPPRDNPCIIGFLKLLLPLIMKFQMHDARLEVVGDGLKRFAALKGKRTVICPNHPTSDDPQTLFAFSKLVGEDFNFLAAREVFDWDFGLRGWAFQMIGCYSVVRGAVDRESFKTTKRVIVEGRKKLVIFPEGEISRQNTLTATISARRYRGRLPGWRKGSMSQAIVRTPSINACARSPRRSSRRSSGSTTTSRPRTPASTTASSACGPPS